MDDVSEVWTTLGVNEQAKLDIMLPPDSSYLSELAHKQHRARLEEDSCEGVSAQCAIVQPCQGKASTALAGEGSDGEDSATLASAGNPGEEAGSGAEEVLGCAAEDGEEPQSYHTPSDALEGLDIGHTSIPELLLEKLEDERGIMPFCATGGKHVWSEVSGPEFNIRCKDYLTSKHKQSSAASACHVVGVDLFASEETNAHIAMWPGSVFQKRKRNQIRKGEPMTPMLIVSWLVPGFNFAFYMEPHSHYLEEQSDGDRDADDEPQIFGKMLRHFMAPGNDKFRQKRLKFIPRVVEGPWLVKKGVGTTPAILCSKLDSQHYTGENYCEIDIDVCSSVVAGKIMNMCKGAAKDLAIDMAFVMEGKKEEELPERLLGAIRIHHCDLPGVEALGDPTLAAVN